MTKRFHEAVIRWDELHKSEKDEDYNALEAAERIILKHRPRDEAEAEAMTRVLAFNLQTGERFDGLDRSALETLAAWRLASADVKSLDAWRRSRRPAEPRQLET